MDVPVMQAVRLKGTATAEAVALSTGRRESDVTAALAALVHYGDLGERSGGFRVTRPGRDRLDSHLVAERRLVDQGVMAALYQHFVPLNAAFTLLMHRWQVRAEPPGDSSYEAWVLADLDDLHLHVARLVDRIVDAGPARIGPYAHRFASAIAMVRGGITSWLVNPRLDSYQTVWLELEEELIWFAGLSGWSVQRRPAPARLSRATTPPAAVRDIRGAAECGRAGADRGQDRFRVRTNSHVLPVRLRHVPALKESG